MLDNATACRRAWATGACRPRSRPQSEAGQGECKDAGLALAPKEGVFIDHRGRGAPRDAVATGYGGRRGQALQRGALAVIGPGGPAGGRQRHDREPLRRAGARLGEPDGADGVRGPGGVPDRRERGLGDGSGRRVQLRDLSLPPGAALDVAVTVDVGCGAGAYAWSVRAKQANRFNGSPGNDFVLVSAPEDLVTTVTGARALRFAAQPQDARVDERLSAADFDPAGPPISVELVDGAGDRVTAASPTISLTLASLTGFGTLSGGAPSPARRVWPRSRT